MVFVGRFLQVGLKVVVGTKADFDQKEGARTLVEGGRVALECAR